MTPVPEPFDIFREIYRIVKISLSEPHIGAQAILSFWVAFFSAVLPREMFGVDWEAWRYLVIFLTIHLSCLIGWHARTRVYPSEKKPFGPGLTPEAALIDWFLRMYGSDEFLATGILVSRALTLCTGLLMYFGPGPGWWGVLFFCAALVYLLIFLEPINSLATIIGVVLVSSFILFFNGLNFFALTLCVVYIGAVSMLFLFVVMLVPAQKFSYNKSEKFRLYGITLVGINFFALHTARKPTPYLYAAHPPQNTAEDHGLFNAFYGDDLLFYATSLYSKDAALFLLITGLLVVALLCAVVLATATNTKKLAEVRTQSLVGLFVVSTTPGPFTYLLYYAITAAALCGVLALIAKVGAFFMKGGLQKETDKGSQYECGFNPFDSATRLPFNVQFYLVGILFIIFDVELVAVIPWLLSMSGHDWLAVGLLGFFVSALGVAFAYEWARGALNWSTAV
jgi:NADH:ubiquinone oxidoreductase subunit 3 (subunit A)/NADH:ubiquinone oxidoreductase subunit 6 (subunit J)